MAIINQMATLELLWNVEVCKNELGMVEVLLHFLNLGC